VDGQPGMWMRHEDLCCGAGSDGLSGFGSLLLVFAPWVFSCGGEVGAQPLPGAADPVVGGPRAVGGLFEVMAP
jgi:hypothetical protein